MIYINITSTYNFKRRTGIQRVVVTLSDLLCKHENYKIVVYDHLDAEFKILKNFTSVSDAVYQETCESEPLPYSALQSNDIFIDSDAAWTDSVDRLVLYPLLKKRGVKIFTLHYDSVPILNSSWSHTDTTIKYIHTFYAKIAYSDYIFSISQFVKDEIDSLSQDYLGVKKPGSVIHLGSLPLQALTDVKKIDKFRKQFKNIIDQRFILAVGTLEPRKNYQLLFDSYLSSNIHNGKLVIVGRKGWNIDIFVDKLKSHQRYNKDIFWLNDISDEELSFLYQECYLYVTSSFYEGYGLPVIEALTYGAASISSNGGALPEVVGDSAYIFDLSVPDSLKLALESAYHDEAFYKNLKHRAHNFKCASWQEVTASVEKNIEDFQTKSVNYNFNHPAKQIIYLSICPKKLKLSVQSVEKNMPFIDEIIVLTKDSCIDECNQALSDISLKYQILTDEDILAENEIDISDHLSRNTILRRKLYQHTLVQENFIAADDDYLALQPINSEFYINNNRHVCYYFYTDISTWPGGFPVRTSYDNGLLATGNYLKNFGFPTKAYSSHMPQIINKKLVNEIFDQYLTDKKSPAVDEWSFYFNVAVYSYPDCFSSIPYKTLSWPGNSTDWPCDVIPDEFIFQNYYDVPANGYNKIAEKNRSNYLKKAHRNLVKTRQNEIEYDGQYVQPIYLELSNNHTLKFSSESYQLSVRFSAGVDNPRRIYVISDSPQLSGLSVQMKLYSSSDSLKKSLRNEKFNLDESIWCPLYPTEIPGKYIVTCELYRAQFMISSESAEIFVV